MEEQREEQRREEQQWEEQRWEEQQWEEVHKGGSREESRVIPYLEGILPSLLCIYTTLDSYIIHEVAIVCKIIHALNPRVQIFT